MPIIRFTGRVLPAKLRVSIPNQPTLTWKADDLGLEMTFQVRIQDGSITIDCDVNRFDESAHLVPLFMRASDIATSCVELTAFVAGIGLTVVLETFTDPVGASIALAAQRPSLAACATTAKMGTADFDTVLRIVLAEPLLSMALGDLIGGILLPQRAQANCMRAIGALQPYFAKPGSSSEAAGLALRDSLQINRSYLQRITRAPKGTDVIEAAWIVMNRFLEYQKRGGQPLPLSEFPLLT